MQNPVEKIKNLIHEYQRQVEEQTQEERLNAFVRATHSHGFMFGKKPIDDVEEFERLIESLRCISNTYYPVPSEAGPPYIRHDKFFLDASSGAIYYQSEGCRQDENEPFITGQGFVTDYSVDFTNDPYL